MRQEIVTTACRSAIKIPAATAMATPAAGPPCKAPNAPQKAPVSIIPSRPMLTTPLRSEYNAPNAQRRTGTNSRSAEAEKSSKSKAQPSFLSSWAAIRSAHLRVTAMLRMTQPCKITVSSIGTAR